MSLHSPARRAARPPAAPAGALRHLLAIEEPVDADDEAGGATRSYRDAGSAWGSIELLGAEAVVEDGRPFARLRLRIVMRWRADLHTQMRLRLGERRFAIRAVADADWRRRRLIILAEEETP